ncbi:MAG: hypothetical protein ABR985_00630 [Methanotrichaceae archaeon]|jgi:DNA repair ATPase RecN
MTTSTIEQFLARAGTPKHIEEMRFAQAYRSADQALGEQRIELISHLSAEKQGDKIVSAFDSGVESVLQPLAEAEEKASAVKKDVDRYLKCLGECQSVAEMTEKLGRLRIVIRNSEFSAKSVLDQTVKTSKKTSFEAMVDPKVVDGYAKADRLSKENQPEIDDLLSRIQSARKILEKY